MRVSGGIRFLPLYGQSGSGKSSAALELATHLPELKVAHLSRDAIEDASVLRTEVEAALINSREGLVAVVDQYEEAAAERAAIPTSFVEKLALLDRGELRSKRILFIWLTTSRHFQQQLASATSRNRRILLDETYELKGPEKTEWPGIIQETFQFHNNGQDLADYEVLEQDLEDINQCSATLGSSIEQVGERLFKYTSDLHDLSQYLVVMLWPVTDGLRITRIQQFTDPHQGYKVDWSAWFRQLNADDQKQLPLREYNRARLYFDLRLVPVAAADLHKLCLDLDDIEYKIANTYVDRFKSTHFFSVVNNSWKPEVNAPLRERESRRADEARAWYETVTSDPTKLGRRIARVLTELGLTAKHEQTLSSTHGKVRADVFIERRCELKPKVIVELKAFSAENTMPSTICSQVQTTLRRHAQFAGFLQRQ